MCSDGANLKGRHEKLAIVIHILQNTHDFVISRCFAEDGTDMYKVSKRTYSESEDIFISISGC